MSEEMAALCAQCNKATQKIYGEYECADCYIKELEDALEVRTSYNSQAIAVLEKEVNEYREQLEDQADLLSYKVAFKLLVDELIKSNDVNKI